MIAVLAGLLAAASAPSDTACIWNRSLEPGPEVISISDDRRRSPRDSVSFRAGGAAVKCATAARRRGGAP